MTRVGLNQKPILYVEDEENDVLLVRLALERAGGTTPLVIATDGKEAIEYLSRTGHYAKAPKEPPPCLVLLDLNLPIVNGFEVLGWIRAQPDLQRLPVIIFSSSDQQKDKERAREMGANDYLVKPVNMARMDEMMSEMNERWLKDEGAPLTGQQLGKPSSADLTKPRGGV